MGLLFVTSTRIGDAVLSTGLLSHLIGAYPEARITVACGEAAAGLFVAVPNLERILPITKRRAGLHWLDLWLAVAGKRWDVVVDLRASALAWMLRAGTRVIQRPDDGERHRVQRLGALLDLDPPPAPHLRPALRWRVRAWATPRTRRCWRWRERRSSGFGTRRARRRTSARWRGPRSCTTW